MASNQVSVRRAGSLPRASFRFRLTADTLASGYRGVQPPPVRTSCLQFAGHLIVIAHAGHTAAALAKARPGLVLALSYGRADACNWGRI